MTKALGKLHHHHLLQKCGVKDIFCWKVDESNVNQEGVQKKTEEKEGVEKKTEGKTQEFVEKKLNKK